LGRYFFKLALIVNQNKAFVQRPLVVTIFSLGLLLPWAKIRMYRYISGATLVEANGDIESFVDEANSTQSSFGEALADFEGVEVSI